MKLVNISCTLAGFLQQLFLPSLQKSLRFFCASVLLFKTIHAMQNAIATKNPNELIKCKNFQSTPNKSLNA